ncbi:MAG: Fic family protein [Actinomycetia bacterium]|nr:Fic family protein [Actinomycetes bacterium]
MPINGTDGRTGRAYEHYAFVPGRPPERVELTDETHVLLAEASAALAGLDAGSSQVPNPGLLRRPALRREAQSTSALEGTVAPFDAVLGADTDNDEDDEVMKEVLNYVSAAELGFSLIRENPITVGLLRQLQRVLVEGTPSESPDSGDLRHNQVVIGPDGCSVEEARFVPPPADDRLRSGLDEWTDWINTPHPALAPVTQAAIAHYQFEALHPFSDGNGRIGRLVIVLQLCRLGVLHDGLLTVSPWFELRRRDYQDHLLALSQTGNWEPWIRFFSSAIRDQAAKTADQVSQLLAYQEMIKLTVRANGWTGVIVTIAEELIGFPVFTVQSISDRHNVTFATANRAVARLREAGIVSETTGRNYGRMFVAQDVYSVIA